MPSTQAYSVDWDVTIAAQNVNRDVVEAVIEQKDGTPDSATVELDTSKTPHAYEEEATVVIQLDDGNEQVTFRGRADAVKDDKEDPLVTIDAREPEGALDDVSAVGVVDEPNLFRVIDGIINGSPGQIRGITFDPSSLESQYGTFGNSVIFGELEAYAIPPALGGLGDNYGDSWTQQETTGGQGKSAELVIDYYRNTTGTTYQGELIGEDGDGNEVTATFDMPPGEDAQDAFGVETFKLPLAGGNGLFAAVTDFTTNINGAADTFTIGATVKNYVKTDYRFRVESDQSVRDAINLIVGYISTLDNARDWDFRVSAPVTGTPELIVEPESDTQNPDTYVFTEGDNVLRPVANQSLDGVYNMVKVNGAGGVNVWVWAYKNTYYYSFNNPFESGEYPDNPDFSTTFGNTGQVNDINQIDLRARGVNSPNADDVFQALDLAKEAVQQLYRTPVSGVATVTGLHPASPGDNAEVYYPSRGIPAKVADNIYTVKAVEYTVATDEATTKIDFGVTEPKTGDLIQAASGAGGLGSVRNDLSSGLQNNLQDTATQQSDGTFPLKGTIQQRNDDGTWVVQGEDGETYDNVEIV